MNHAWGENKILTFLDDGRQLYAAQKDESVPFPAPRFISCWISEKCNLDCTYCFFSNTNHDKAHLYIDTKKFLAWLQSMRDMGTEALEFSGGGEPTLHPEFQHIFTEAKRMGFSLGLITHGCNEMPLIDIVRNFSYVRMGLDAATVETHDAIKRNHRKNYWFPRAVENIKDLVKLRDEINPSGFTVGIKVVLNTINAHELEEMIHLAYETRVNYIQIKHEHSSDHSLGELKINALESILRKYSWENERQFTKVKGVLKPARATTGCFMSPIHTVVTATGKILQCCFFEDRPIGTIDQPIAEVWGSKIHREVMKRTTVKECDKIDCRWNFYNRRMKEVLEDPLHQTSFI